MLSFRRTVSDQLTNLWHELVSIVEDVQLNEDADQII